MPELSSAMPLDEKGLLAAFRVNHHPDAEPSSVELAKLSAAIRAYLSSLTPSPVSELVWRLRSEAAQFSGRGFETTVTTCTEAADRIAALEAQLAERVDALATRIVDEAIRRYRELHDYAGRPAWEDAIRQSILSALEATPPAPKVTEAAKHKFVPHEKFPWFCAECGYAPHEPLMHLTAAQEEGAARPGEVAP